MSLAREIVAALPRMMEEYPHGPRAADIAGFIAAPVANVRRAFDAIKAEALAIIVRYQGSKARHVVPIGHFAKTQRACAFCDVFFEVAEAKIKRRCCSRKCGIAWSWTLPGVKEKRQKAMSEQRRLPKERARLAEHNKRRWSDPEQRRKLSEQNRREWADPVKKAKRAAKIQAVHGAPEMRKFYSDLKKEQWKDADYREHTIAAATAGHQTAYSRAKASKLLKDRWQNPQTRPRYMAGAKKAAAKRGAQQRGKKLTPEHVEKMKASRRATAEARGYWARPGEKSRKRNRSDEPSR